MGGHRLGVLALRQVSYDRELGCERLRVVGWRSWCSCGWKGPSRSSVALARVDGREHRLEVGGVGGSPVD